MLGGSRPNSRMGQDYERLKMQCVKAMTDLQALQNQHSSTLKRCEDAVKKADFYHGGGHATLHRTASVPLMLPPGRYAPAAARDAITASQQAFGGVGL
ncbi:hypothetical protein CRUP_002555 [Coryphaenoides rupestris]|nr:hypothetical protein CRUP_002555 [Coryphaenoides rupestris]